MKEDAGMVRASEETTTDLLRIERTLWENDARVYHDTYSPDAVLIFPGVGRIDRETAVAAIEKENAEGRAWAEVHFNDAVGRWLTRDTAILVSSCLSGCFRKPLDVAIRLPRAA
jgi:hypothetical protein